MIINNYISKSYKQAKVIFVDNHRKFVLQQKITKKPVNNYYKIVNIIAILQNLNAFALINL
jgi:hypothetical protein